MSDRAHRLASHCPLPDLHRLPGLWPPDYLKPDGPPLATGAPGLPRTAFANGLHSSSVQPPETNVPTTFRPTDWGALLTDLDPPVIFRHSGWQRIRSKVRTALLTNNSSLRVVQRFDLCGSEPWVAVDPEDPSRFVLLANCCHSRWCLPCARERGRTIAGNLTLKLGDEPTRFLTLTLKHSDSPLRDQISRLYSCFRKLRALRFWRENVDGGAAVLEIRHSWKSDSWHVHLHVLFHGGYVSQRALAAAWWRITGDSYVVDIRLVHGAKHAAAYVSKYLSKPISTTISGKPAKLAELIAACRGRRLVLTFGSWRGFRLTEKIDATEWKSLCPLTVLYERFEAGDEDAARIVHALEISCPDARIQAGRSPPTPANS